VPAFGLDGRPYGSSRDEVLTLWLWDARGRCVKKPGKRLGKRLGKKMDFGFIAALVIAIVAIVDLFVDLPIIGGYAFWVLLGGFLVLAAKTKK
jgi:hypothetical protein